MRRTRALSLALLLALLARPARAGDPDEETEADNRLFVCPEVLADRGAGDGWRWFDGRGRGLRVSWVLTGDRGPGDADLVADLSLVAGAGDRREALAFGARWIPLVRPRLTPFLGGGLTLDWAQLDRARLGLEGGGRRAGFTWGAYAGGGFEFERFFFEARAVRLHAVAGEPRTLYLASVGFAF